MNRSTRTAVRFAAAGALALGSVGLASLAGASSAQAAGGAPGACKAADIKLVYPRSPGLPGDPSAYNHVKRSGGVISFAYTTDGNCSGQVGLKGNFLLDGKPSGGPAVPGSPVIQAVGKSGTLSLPIPVAQTFGTKLYCFAQFDAFLANKKGGNVTPGNPLAGARIKLSGCESSPPVQPPTPQPPAPNQPPPNSPPVQSPPNEAVTVVKQTTPNAAPSGRTPGAVQTDDGQLAARVSDADSAAALALLGAAFFVGIAGGRRLRYVRASANRR